jgi:hypothetical protein
MSDIVFVLWSNKHGTWWRPDARGYTEDIGEAGRYSQAAAVQHVVQSAFHGKVDKVTCMVVAPECYGAAS